MFSSVIILVVITITAVNSICDIPTFSKQELSVKLTNDTIKKKIVTGCIGPNLISSDIIHIHITVGSTITTLFEDAYHDLTDLNEILISNRVLQDIRPGAFKNLPSLRQLDCSNNLLRELRKDMFTGLNLRFINFGGNRISHIAPDTFTNLESLQWVFLASNKISRFNVNWFKPITSLIGLDFSNNDINYLPANSLRVQNTGLIDFSNNQLTGIHPNAFTGDDFGDYHGPMTVYFGNNNLQEIPITFLSKLISRNEVHLHFQNNLLTYLPFIRFQNMANIRNFNITNNPLKCSCYRKLVRSKVKQDVVPLLQKLGNEMEDISSETDNTIVCISSLSDKETCLEEVDTEVISYYQKHILYGNK